MMVNWHTGENPDINESAMEDQFEYSIGCIEENRKCAMKGNCKSAICVTSQN